MLNRLSDIPCSSESFRASARARSWPRQITFVGQAGEFHWRLVGKLGEDGKITSHGLDVFAKRRKQ